ncbi:MAG: sensor histidine kinase [Aristaeellaceae bacterium]
MDTKAEKRKIRRRSSRGIRYRVMMYLTVFVAAVIGLLWLFQIVLLDDFYRWSKTYQIRQTSDMLADNVDNAELERLMNHLASRSDMCIVLLSEHGKTLMASEDIRFCLIHRMSKADRSFWCDLAPEDGSVLIELFNVAPQMDEKVNAFNFRGRVPQATEDRQALLCVRRVSMADGTQAYLLLNAIITPLDATVETLRTQLMVITVVVLLGAVLLAWMISRRVARPIIETNESARSLSRGQYEPPEHGGEYREMAELNQTLALAAKELSQVERLQHELIANISHDLRTPLTMIGGYAEVMRDIPGEASPENLQIIIDETGRLTSLVSELLDFSKLQTGSVALEIAAFDLTDAVETIVQRVARMTEKDGYHLIFAPGEHVSVRADEKRIGQVVYNLIGNALTYTGEDKTVTVTQMVGDGRVCIAIRDTGRGIPEEEVPLIWNRYYRAKESHRRAVIGSGLGLSIVQSILEKHGAKYGVESTVGEGTTFWFELEVEPS